MLSRFLTKPPLWIDYALTLPVFLAYHVGVVFLGGIRNATDLVTPWFLSLTSSSLLLYFGLVLFSFLAFTLGFAVAAKSEKSLVLDRGKYLQVVVEGAVYALLLRTIASLFVRTLFGAGILKPSSGIFADIILSLGAGFYEEVAFRVVLFGLGAKFLLSRMARGKTRTKDNTVRFAWSRLFVAFAWAVVVSLVFSAIHYVGPYGDKFELTSFTFRFVLGLLLTQVYAARGFGVVVWTHALYDLFIVFHL